jgi:uncharacterized protein
VSKASENPRTGHVAAQGPIRTCIGCRRRAAAAELLRVAVATDASGTAVAVPVVPDPRRRIQSRGAWVHPDPGCVALAQRRRAFARALHVPGALDPAPVVEFVAAHYGEAVRQERPASGTPQETKS